MSICESWRDALILTNNKPLQPDDVVYIVGDDNEPISVTVGEVLHNQTYWNESYNVFRTYAECYAHCHHIDIVK